MNHVSDTIKFKTCFFQVVTKSISTQPESEEEEILVSGKTRGRVGSEPTEKIFQPRFGIALTDADADADVSEQDPDMIVTGIPDRSLTRDVIESDADVIGGERSGWKPMAVIRQKDMIDFHSQPVSGWMELVSAATSEVIEDRPVAAGKEVKFFNSHTLFLH